ncbi:MptD family putative ECF transporter S component [uncultured Desulfovibrio sp.]|nr:MptD family putative ECF transporter S component [uncultured Desulfovibrio sp.]
MVLNMGERCPWSAHELVVIGVFAAAAKVSTLLVALAGGGMNPVTLILKNLIFTTLLVVMLYKVRTPGTLLLFVGINLLFSMLLMGVSVTLLPPMLGAALLGEAAAWAVGGMRARFGPLAAVAVYDLVYRCLSLGTSWLAMREAPAMVLAAAPIVALGYMGALGGLLTGFKAVKELRHAGIVRF